MTLFIFALALTFPLDVSIIAIPFSILPVINCAFGFCSQNC